MKPRKKSRILITITILLIISLSTVSALSIMDLIQGSDKSTSIYESQKYDIIKKENQNFEFYKIVVKEKVEARELIQEIINQKTKK